MAAAPGASRAAGMVGRGGGGERGERRAAGADEARGHGGADYAGAGVGRWEPRGCCKITRLSQHPETGYIDAMIDPDKIQRIAEETAKASLGAGCVSWVSSAPMIDSRGDEALRITIVLTPGSAETLSDAQLVDVTVRVHDALQMQGEERFPFLGFESEDELPDEAFDGVFDQPRERNWREVDL
jgi:hypothetical protein